MSKPFDDPEASRKRPADELAYVAEVEARHAKANAGPIDVHRYDNDGGSIAYQLQQSGRGEDSVVLCAFDDDNPKARHDAEFAAMAWTDVPKLIAIVREQAEQNAYHLQSIQWLQAEVNAYKKVMEISAKTSSEPYDDELRLRETVQAENAALRERLAKLETALTHALNDLESAIDVIDAEGIEEDAIDESRVWLALTRRELLSESAKDVPT